MSILEKIVEAKRKEIAKRKASLKLSTMRKKLTNASHNFYRCLKGRNNIIAEIKFASPSMKEVRGRTVKEVAEAYDSYANAISVLTDREFFKGDVSYIKEVSKHTKAPILRKDFIIDDYQVYESRYYGADAILLIAQLLPEKKLSGLISLTGKLGMDALVEVHTKDELQKAVSCGAKIIGINNRDISSEKMEVILSITKQLIPHVPKGIIVVSESGFSSRKDILDVNSNAVLIGSFLMKSGNITASLSSMHRCKVKICGITSMEDAKMAIGHGADLLGFNFYNLSERNISTAKAKEIISSLPLSVQSVGVFVDGTVEGINSMAESTGIDFIQLHGNYIKGKYIRPVIHVRKVGENGIETPFQKEYITLYDTKSARHGGSGKSFNPSFLKGQSGKIIIAGGLTQKNVSQALKLHPYGVDTASGVEKSPGIKDGRKVKAFIEAVVA